MEDSDKLVGQRLKGTRGVYTLTRYLNEGRTARVYAAEAALIGGETVAVAAKAMRPGLSRAEQEAFQQEALRLAELQGLNAGAAPKYYEHFSTEIPELPEILVLELMTGIKVEDLLQREGRLPEPEALNLGVQLAGILQIVHESMARTYTDLKFENLWWDRAKGQLKLLDWNVLSDVGKLERVPADLLRAARYLYRILTGGEVREEGGIVVTPFMRHPNWPTLSRPMQSFLRKALHRNPEERFATAAKQGEALRTIQRLWQQEPSRLLTTVEDRLAEEYDRTKYENVLETLDVLRRRRDAGEEFSTNDSSRLDALLTRVEGRLSKEQTLLERGRHLFDGRSYKEARELFAKSVDEDPWDLAGWRWREAAAAGAATNDFERVSREVSSALDALNNSEYERAEQMLSRIHVAALRGLLAEAQAQRLLAEAQKLAADGRRLVDQGEGQSADADDLLRRAQDAFGKAADALRDIVPDDYRQQVRSDIGDPAVLGRALADEQRSLAAVAATALRTAGQAAAEGNWSCVETELTKGLEAVPTDSKLVAAAREWGVQRFKDGDPATAGSLLAIASRYAVGDSDLRRLRRLVRQTSEATSLLEGLHWQAGLRAMAEVLALPANAEAKTTAEETLRSAAERSLQGLEQALEPETVDGVLRQVQMLALDRPSLQGWADRHARRRDALLTEWTTQRVDTWSVGELLEFAPRLWLLIPTAPERRKLADALLPAVRKQLEASAGYAAPSPAPALLKLYGQLTDVSPAAPNDRAFPDKQYCRLVAADVAAQEAQGWQAALLAARAALANAPESLCGPLAAALQPILDRTLGAVPPDGNLNDAAAVLKGAEEALAESSSLQASTWTASVADYRKKYEAECAARRNRSYESVHKYILALRAAGDEESYNKARASLDEAVLLTPKDAPTYNELKALGNTLETWRGGFAVSKEDLAKVRKTLDELSDKLALATKPDDFATLRKGINEAKSTAERAQEHELLAACAAAMHHVDEVEGNLDRVQVLQSQLANLQDRLKALAGDADLPGIAEAREELWRRIATTAGDILALQPGHRGATTARADHQQHTGAVALDSKLEMFRSLRDNVGPHAATLEQARTAYEAGQTRDAAALLLKLPEEWQSVPEATELRKQIQAGEGYLQRAEALKAARVFDDDFDTKLHSLLTTAPTPAYATAANLGVWLQSRRTASIAALTRAKPEQRPALLFTAVLADQYARLAGAPVAANGSSLAPQDIAEQVMAPPKNASHPTGDLLAALPTASDPRSLAKEVEDAAAGWLPDDQGGGGRNIRRIVLTALGIAAAVILLARFIWADWPGVAPDSRAKANAVVAALTTNPPTAIVQKVQQRVTVPVTVHVPVTVTVPVTVVATPTDLPAVAATQVPAEASTTGTNAATGTPTSTIATTPNVNSAAATTLTPPAASPTTAPTGSTATATTPDSNSAASTTLTPPAMTPTPGPWNEEERRQKFFAAATKAALAKGVSALPTGVTADSIVAIIDDKDPGAVLVLNGSSVPERLTNDASYGLYTGMSFIGMTTLETGLQFRWPAVWLASQGHYGAYIFVPREHGTMAIACQIKTGGPSSSALPLAGNSMPVIDEVNFNDQWVYLGDFQMAEPGDVVMACEPNKLPKNQTKPIQAGFDAAAFVRLP